MRKRVARGRSERKRGDDAREAIGFWDAVERTEGSLSEERSRVS